MPVRYVALGSSFAAGSGLGKRIPGSPVTCLRTVNGYPEQLARLCGLAIVNVTCGGAQAKHVLHRRQLFERPQIDAVDNRADLVTLTIGGNDVGYSGDLIMLSRRARKGFAGFLLRSLWRGPMPVEDRPFAKLFDEIAAVLQQIRRRAPHARMVVVTYPSLAPLAGTCPKLGITESEAALMRAVGDRLAEVTREAARAANAILVDIASISGGHDCCGAIPWVNGAIGGGVPFHPNLVGAEATARHIAELCMLPEVGGRSSEHLLSGSAAP